MKPFLARFMLFREFLWLGLVLTCPRKGTSRCETSLWVSAIFKAFYTILRDWVDFYQNAQKGRISYIATF